MIKERPLYADRIVHDPAIMAGKAVVKGTRIPVELVVGHLAHHPDLDELLAAYPELTVEDVQAALAFAAAALAQRAPTSPSAPAATPQPVETAGQALLRLAGIKGTGPADLSARIDDYLYGQGS